MSPPPAPAARASDAGAARVLGVTILSPVLARVDIASSSPADVSVETELISPGSPATTQRGPLLALKPATTYQLRIRLDPEKKPGSEAEGLAQQSLRTPSVPPAPPATPKNVGARALSPFAVEVHWQGATGTPYGYEIQEVTASGLARRRIVDATQTSAELHNLAPGARWTFRVRAFNSRGPSQASEPVRVSTLPLSELRDPSARPAQSPCTSAKQVIAAWKAEDDANPILRGSRLFGPRGPRVDFFTDPESCGNAVCDTRMFAQVDGCYRLIGGVGAHEPSDVKIVSEAASGWPIVQDYGHSSAFAFYVYTLAFLGGRYVVVDTEYNCGHDEERDFPEDLSRCTPPFATDGSQLGECQF